MKDIEKNGILKKYFFSAYAVGVTYLDKMKGENTWQM
mgnify:CR=1 FL=1